jgi:hypothetical protein
MLTRLLFRELHLQHGLSLCEFYLARANQPGGTYIVLSSAVAGKLMSILLKLGD